jgi:hypothetical protein
MNYLVAMVYHYREHDEHPRLLQVVEQSVTEDAKLEIEMIKRTGAEAFREEGALEELRKTLRSQLVVRFGEIPKSIAARIDVEVDRAELKKWLNNFAKARRLKDVGIPMA